MNTQESNAIFPRSGKDFSRARKLGRRIDEFRATSTDHFECEQINQRAPSPNIGSSSSRALHAGRNWVGGLRAGPRSRDDVELRSFCEQACFEQRFRKNLTVWRLADQRVVVRLCGHAGRSGPTSQRCASCSYSSSSQP